MPDILEFDDDDGFDEDILEFDEDEAPKKNIFKNNTASFRPSANLTPGQTIEILGKVTSIANRLSSGFTVMNVADNVYGRISVVGEMPAFAVGAKVKADAVVVNHPKYGLQCKTNNVIDLGYDDEEGIVKYLSSHIFKGIGTVSARNIVDKFGMETLEILDTNPERLKEVKGLETKWEKMAEDWKSKRAANKAISFLMQKGLTIGQASSVYKEFEDNTIDFITENPYRLINIRGIGFKTADTIAINMGIKRDSPFRIDATVVYIMTQSLQEQGHCYLPISQLNTVIVETLNGDVGITAAALGVQRKAADGTLVIEDEVRVYLKTAWNAERYIRDKFVKLLDHNESEFHSDVKIDSRKDLMTRLDAMGVTQEITLSEEQLQALETVINKRVCIITGGPGVGKTLVTRTMCQLFREYHIDYALCAPTGRAAKRLSEATGNEAKTIHRLLKYDPMAGGFQFNEYNKLFQHCIIIDESSMVDLFLMKSLVEAVGDDARIIIIGDVDQLPSVGPGTILRDLINSEKIPVVRLTKVYRQEKGSTIITVAHNINNGIVPILPPPSESKGHNCIFVKANNHEDVLASMMTIVTESLPNIGVKANDIQVLSPMKIGPLGVDVINPMLQKSLNPPESRKPEIKMKDGNIFRLDDRIMQIRNDYNKEVFNGDVGIISGIVTNQDNETTIYVQYPDKNTVVDYAENEFVDLKLAYSLSTHKSQGGEFPVVVMLLHDSHYRMLQRNLVYTAVTRAKKLFIFIGTDSAFTRSVYNKTESRRNTTLKELLMQ